MRYGVIFLLSCLFFLGSSWPTLAEVDKNGEQQKEYKWSFTAYGGLLAKDDLWQVLTLTARLQDDYFLAVGALSRELYRYKHWISFEAEGQIGKHFGDMTHWEFNALIIGRWLYFPWNKRVRTSFAVGNGMSFATRVPEVEKEESEDALSYKNYLLFELTFGLPKYRQWDLSLRIHHRSGIFGVFNRGGSNFVCLGIKYNF